MYSYSTHDPISIEPNRFSQYSNHKLKPSSWRCPETCEMLVDWQCLTPNGFQDILITSFSKEHSAAQKTFHLSLRSHSESATTQLLKRSRPRTDVDGEGSENMQRKKRRLRLHLITSRLSRPYATPPTHINSRRAVRVGVWARQRVLGRDLLRKAAILNSIRIKKVAAKEAEQQRPEAANISTLSHQSTRLFGFSAQQFIPPPPSPLGLSNYDAFDQDDDLLGEEADEVAGSDTIYSDFRVLDPTSPDVEDYDSLRPFDDDGNERELVAELGEDVMGLIIENEKQSEIEVAFRGP